MLLLVGYEDKSVVPRCRMPFAEILRERSYLQPCWTWCQGRELNPRPRAYESPALPLSYPGNRKGLANMPCKQAYLQVRGY